MNNQRNNRVWGEHLVLNLSNCNKANITNPTLIKEFSKVLVDKIDMVPYGEPQVIYFGEDLPETAGWTLLQFIETSNIMAHFCDDGSAYIDIFSCKSFDPEIALDLIQTYFEPEEMATLMLTRSPIAFTVKTDVNARKRVIVS